MQNISWSLTSHYTPTLYAFLRLYAVVCSPMWLVLTSQDYIIHECAPRFAVDLFTKYMNHEYEIHSIYWPDTDTCLNHVMCHVSMFLLIILHSLYPPSNFFESPSLDKQWIVWWLNTCCFIRPDRVSCHLTKWGGRSTAHDCIHAWPDGQRAGCKVPASSASLSSCAFQRYQLKAFSVPQRTLAAIAALLLIIMLLTCFKFEINAAFFFSWYFLVRWDGSPCSKSGCLWTGSSRRKQGGRMPQTLPTAHEQIPRVAWRTHRLWRWTTETSITQSET